MWRSSLESCWGTLQWRALCLFQWLCLRVLEAWPGCTIRENESPISCIFLLGLYWESTWSSPWTALRWNRVSGNHNSISSCRACWYLGPQTANSHKSWRTVWCHSSIYQSSGPDISCQRSSLEPHSMEIRKLFSKFHPRCRYLTDQNPQSWCCSDHQAADSLASDLCDKSWPYVYTQHQIWSTA